jgi:Zn-dependent protease with chaperone function
MTWLTAFLSQSMVHALVAALVVDGLVRAWRLEDAAWRLRLRWLPIALPVAWLPVVFLCAPWRQAPWFAARCAVFAGERWNLLHVGPMGLGTLLLVVAAGAGSGLFLRDAVPPLLEQLRRGPPPLDGPWAAVPDAIARRVDRLSGRLGTEPPAIQLIRRASPVLLCTGGPHASLVISTGTIDRLGDDELEAALAHELAHAAFRDPACSYLLMAARAAMFFNPAVQWTGRVLVDEMERRADQASVRLVGNAPALARAIALLFRAGDPPPVDRNASFERVFWRTRLAGVQGRCRRLTGAFPPPGLADGPFRFGVAAVGLAAVLFFVV